MAKKLIITSVGTNKSIYLRISIPDAYIEAYNLKIGDRYQWKYSNGILYITPLVENNLEYKGVLITKYPKQSARISLPTALAVAHSIDIEKDYEITNYAGFLGLKVD